MPTTEFANPTPWSDQLTPHARQGTSVCAIFPFQSAGCIDPPDHTQSVALGSHAGRWRSFDSKDNTFLPALVTHHDFGLARSEPGIANPTSLRRAWSRSFVLPPDISRPQLVIEHHRRVIHVDIVDASVHFFDTGSCSTMFVALRLSPADNGLLTATDLLTILNAQCFRERQVLDPDDIAGTLATAAGLRNHDLRRPDSASALSIISLDEAPHALVDGLAYLLLLGLPPNVQPDHEGTLFRSVNGIHRRDNEITYVAGQSAAALVLNVSPSTTRYVRETLPMTEGGSIYLLAYLYALHQRSALVAMSGRLAELPLLEADTDQGSADALESALEEVTRIRLDFERLIAWTRYRVLSTRPGLQQFYDLVHAQLRLNDLEAEVRTAIEGTTSLTNFQLGRLQFELERRETLAQERVERTLNRLGIPAFGASLAFSVLGMDIDGLSTPGGWGLGASIGVFVGFLTLALGTTLHLNRQSRREND